MRGDAGLDTDVRDGDGKNRTDLGYVLEAEWAGRDDTQDVGGAIEKKKKKRSLLNNWVNRSTRWKDGGRVAFGVGAHWVPRYIGQMARDPKQSQLCLFLAL